jgi:hypothetical protein
MATIEDLERARSLREKAAELRSSCRTFGNLLAGTVDSCAAAATGMEELAAKLETGATRTERAAAQRVDEKIGDVRDIASGSELASLANDIKRDLGVATMGIGAMIAIGVGIWFAAQLMMSRRRGD